MGYFWGIVEYCKKEQTADTKFKMKVAR